MKHLIPLLISIFSAAANAAETSDTYNFYFQKAPGPATVNQGEASATASAAVKPSGSASVSSIDARMQERDDVKKWYVNLGGSNWFLGGSAMQYSGFTAYVGHRLDRYVSVEAGAAFGKRSFDGEILSEYMRSIPDTMNVYSLGGKITPFTVRVFGWRLAEVSATGGMSYVTKIERFSPYIGLELDVILNPNFALSLYHRTYLRDESAGFENSMYTWAKKIEEHNGVELSLRF